MKLRTRFLITPKIILISTIFLMCLETMVVQKFVFRENWVGSKVFAGMKTIFLAIFDPIWTYILAPKDPNK